MNNVPTYKELREIIFECKNYQKEELSKINDLNQKKLSDKNKQLSKAHQATKIGYWELNIEILEMTLSNERQILLDEKSEDIKILLSEYSEK